MNVQPIPIEQLHHNPYQTRVEEDGAHIQAIADSMRSNDSDPVMRGMLQIPMARKNGNGYELAFGHTRLAAWQVAFPGVPFPVDIREMTDRQMSDRAAEENAQRKNLTAIETARAIQRRVKDFSLTQMEAAKPFGYASQGAVANLLALLKLPAPIQEMVQQRKLAERNARALRVVERLDAALVVPIAEKSMSADNAEEYIDHQIAELLEKKGRDLKDVPWKLNWPKQPLALDLPINGLREIPACEGCPYLFRRTRNARYGWDDIMCGRVECYGAKLEIAIAKKVESAAAKLKIAVAVAGEKMHIVFDGSDTDYHAEEKFKKLVKAHPEELRLVPFIPKDRDYSGHKREEVLGSKWMALATTNKAVTTAWLEASNQSERKELVLEAQGGTESDAQRKKRIEREEKEAAERRAERSAQLKQKYETLYLIEHASKLIAEQMQISGGVLVFAHQLFQRQYHSSAPELQGFDEALEATKEAGERERLLRQHIAAGVIASKVIAWNGHFDKDLSEVCGVIDELCSKDDQDMDVDDFEHFAITLPRGWEKMPVLHTAFNCWHCGKFGSHEGSLTKREKEEEGWLTVPNANEDMIFCCTAHASAYGDGAARSRSNARATKAKSAKKAKK